MVVLSTVLLAAPVFSATDKTAAGLISNNDQGKKLHVPTEALTPENWREPAAERPAPTGRVRAEGTTPLGPAAHHSNTPLESPDDNGRAGQWKRQVTELVLKEQAPSPKGETLSAEKSRENFAIVFAEAKVPHCLQTDGLKHQPPRIAFFSFNGVLGLPFVVLARVRGKCN